MSYFTNDHLKISDIIIDFEENINTISNFNKLLLSINNIDEFNNLRTKLNEQLKNIENNTNILINTLKIIQFNIRKLYDDFALMQCSYGDIENKLKAVINDNYVLLNDNRDLEKQINYKNIIIDEQNNYILELEKSNKNNDKIIKDLKNQIKNKNIYDNINNRTKHDISNKNQTLNNEKIMHYENFLNLKNIFNQNIKNNINTMTENNNLINNIKNKLNNNIKKDLSEKSSIKIKNISNIDNSKYIFKDEYEQNEEYIDNNIGKNETSINNNSSINNKREISNNNCKENIINISNNQKTYENTKDKIINNKINEFNKKYINKNTKKLKRKGNSAKNIFKVKNKNFEFDTGNNKLTTYFLFNLQREKILNNKNTLEFLRKENPKYKI